MNLWETLPSGESLMPTIEYFKAEKKLSDMAVIVFPGGGYTHLAPHEGIGYAKLFNTWGINAFVVNYSVAPAHFPAQLNDARRAVQIVRAKAAEFEINPEKIAVIGSSAGGHLTAMLSTYKGKTTEYASDSVSKEDFIPNLQILCYPVIDLTDDMITHKGSKENLLGNTDDASMAEKLSPQLACDSSTPPAFVWHTAEDGAVSVQNSLNYVKNLVNCGVPAELHVFPYGNHGLGISPDIHAGQWTTLLLNWLKEIKMY